MSGFVEMEAALQELRRSCPWSDSLSVAWAHVRQERCEISMGSEGSVLVWGSGRFGELGRPGLRYCPFPSPLPALRGVAIRQLAAGEVGAVRLSRLD